LADLDASEACIAAALLHSVLDSSMLTEQQLREAMSKEVADTVCNVHKLSGICQVWTGSCLSRRLCMFVLCAIDVRAGIAVSLDLLPGAEVHATAGLAVQLSSNDGLVALVPAVKP
jgi:hypothetical protein